MHPDEAAVLALQHRLQETEATLQSTQRELRTLQMAKVRRDACIREKARTRELGLIGLRGCGGPRSAS